MRKILLKYLPILFLITLSLEGLAQKKVKLKKADKLIGGIDKEGKRFDRFVGNVVFEQNETTIYCDSAILFKKENIVNAFGNVRIVEGTPRLFLTLYIISVSAVSARSALWQQSSSSRDR